MSVQTLTLVFTRSQSTGTARLVLLALADEASSTGDVTAYRRSMSHLSRKANCSLAATKRAIAKLVEIGEVEILEVGTGRSQSSYRISLREVADDPSTRTRGVADDPSQLDEQGHGRDPRGVADGSPIIPLLPVVETPVETRVLTHEVEHVIATNVWEAKTPRPATPFVAVRKIAKALLDAGWAADVIEQAMISAPTISTRAVEIQLSKTRPARPIARSLDEARDEPGGAW